MARKVYTQTRRARYTPKITPLSPPPPHTSSITRPGTQAVAYHIPHAPSSPKDGYPTLKTTIHIPKLSTWTSGLHYHTSHTEYLHLLKGSITVRLGPKITTYSASTGGPISLSRSRSGTCTSLGDGLIIEVPAYARHNWGRADEYHRRRCIGARLACPDDWSDDVVVEEWTAPGDVMKPLFFWNLNGVITREVSNDSVGRREKGGGEKVVEWGLGRWWVPFQLFVIFWELDNWPVFVDLGRYEDGFFPGWMRDEKLNRGVEHAVTWMVLMVVRLVAWMFKVEGVKEERTPKALWEAWVQEKGQVKEKTK